MLILQDRGADSYISPSFWLQSDICISRHVAAEHEGGGQAYIFMIRPLHNLATGLPCTRVAAQQLAYQMRIRWPSMSLFATSLGRPADDSNDFGPEVVSQLVQGSWTSLWRLCLARCELKGKDFLLLSQGDWPNLANLDVSGNSLDAEGMALLANGNWPLLANIRLSFSSTLDANVVAHLSAAEWPIQHLAIPNTPFNADMAANLAHLKYPNLRSLFLVDSALTAAAMSELARADWPSLRMLIVGHDDLDAMSVLLGFDPEKVQEPKSDSSGYADMYHQMRVLKPGVCLWPNLHWITFSSHYVELRATKV